ncbi:TOLL-like receptor [Chamberlinius hualienensis]
MSSEAVGVLLIVALYLSLFSVNANRIQEYIDDIYINAGFNQNETLTTAQSTDEKSCLLYTSNSTADQWTLSIHRWKIIDLKDNLPENCELKQDNDTSILDKTELELYANNITHVIISSSEQHVVITQFYKSFMNLLELDLSNDNLDNVDHVGLCVNSDVQVGGSAFKLKRLKLDGNYFENLKGKLFCQATDLAIVSMANCNLKQIDPEAFVLLKKLKILNLSFNYLQDLDDKLFQENFELRVLNLRNNRLHVIPELRHLSQLGNIDLRRNKIESVSRDNFANLTKLIAIHLQNNNISSIDEGAFDDPEELFYLSLSNNNLQSIDGVLESAKIEKLFIKNNSLIQFSLTDISPTVKVLVISHNSISDLDLSPTNDTDDYQLEYINIDYNQITTLRDLKLPLSLRYLYLKNNSVDELTYNSDFRDEIEQRKSKLIQINLKNNSIRLIPTSLRVVHDRKTIHDGPYYFFQGNPLRCTCEYKGLERFVMDIGQLSCGSLFNKVNNTVASQLCNSNYLNSSRCLLDHSTDEKEFECEFECPLPCDCYTARNLAVVHLDCSKRNLQSIPENLNNRQITQRSKVTLWLDGNNFGTLSSNDFPLYENVREIYLNSSNITEIDSVVFQNVSKLMVLHLENNHIENLPDNVFEGVTNLKELYLFNNMLTNLDENLFSTLNSLQILSLHGNQFVNVELWNLDGLNDLKKLSLRENPWSCDCIFVKHISDFLKNISEAAIDIDEIKCQQQDFLVPAKIGVYENSHCAFELTDVNIA